MFLMKFNYPHNPLLAIIMYILVIRLERKFPEIQSGHITSPILVGFEAATNRRQQKDAEHCCVLIEVRHWHCQISAKWIKGYESGRQTEFLRFDSGSRDRGCSLLRTPISGQIGRSVFPGIQWWTNFDRYIFLMMFNFLHNHLWTRDYLFTNCDCSTFKISLCRFRTVFHVNFGLLPLYRSFSTALILKYSTYKNTISLLSVMTEYVGNSRYLFYTI